MVFTAGLLASTEETKPNTTESSNTKRATEMNKKLNQHNQVKVMQHIAGCIDKSL